MKMKTSLALILPLITPLIFAGTLQRPVVDLKIDADFHAWALTPPRGWNSWDCFGCTLTEAQAKAQADAQAEHLKSAGYEYFTVDIQWYEPNAEGHVYKEGAPLTMDAYGRLLPATNRFPSAVESKGFKPLADYVHAKGLKFGIHSMRGIPRQAVHANTPVFGTTLRAQDIALTNHTCRWNPDMYGVDLQKTGAQAYYDGLVAQWAAWGVDLVKLDDISRPYDEVQLREIEALRRAIDKTGRPIVLSLSPGDTPVVRGGHVNRFANMWRISDDFWDRWQPLHDMFERLHKWEPYRVTGSWPDADMLPFGIVRFNRKCRFTPDEQLTCMTLWCIARSPLIFGGDMTRLDDFTKGLLTNPEVLEVNSASENNRQLSRTGDCIVWTADVLGSGGKYLALFNAGTEEAEIAVNLAALGFTDAVNVRNLWARQDEAKAKGVFVRTLRPHAAMLFRVCLRPIGLAHDSAEDKGDLLPRCSHIRQINRRAIRALTNPRQGTRSISANSRARRLGRPRRWSCSHRACDGSRRCAF